MRRLAAATMIMTMAILWPAVPAEAIEVSELLSNPDEWAGQIVEVTGELVGDFGQHSGSFWIQLNDDPYASNPLLETEILAGTNIGITLRVPPELFRAIASTEEPGGYRRRGPIVLAAGEFRYHDAARAGETYIAVTALEIVEPGRALPSEATGPWGAIGLVMASIAGGVLIRHEVQHRRERQLQV